MNNNNNKIPTITYFISIGVLSILVFGGLVLISNLIKDGLIQLAILISAILIFASLVYLKKQFTPYRWMFVGMVFVLLFTIYPIISTVLISFSNMSGGHLITKEQAIQRLESKSFIPEGVSDYNWYSYVKGSDKYIFLFENEEGQFFQGKPGEELVLVNLESDKVPPTVDDYRLLKRAETVSIIDTLASYEFSYGDKNIQIDSLKKAKELQQKYTYNTNTDSVMDNETQKEYKPVKGTFTSFDGDELIPGYKVNIGLTNYKRFLGNKGYTEPTGSMILWNLSFSFFSVTISFFIGLLIALVFDKLPGKRIIRTLLIIPYPIPVLVSITVWKALLNESMGLITKVLEGLFGAAPQFFTDKMWARVALVMINVYLSYPYFYILASGAIRSIPGDILEAAEIDGASNFVKLKSIILPLILKILAPLLIASFSFNFNNFTLIWGFNAGLPAMADTIVPMGYTDLLISFVYRLGFSTANAANYGFAAAITVLLFFLVSAMVFIQIKSTNALKEEN